MFFVLQFQGSKSIFLPCVLSKVLFFPFISLKARGLKDNVKHKAAFLFCEGLKAYYRFLQESHVKRTFLKLFWKRQLGYKILFSHGSNGSGGVAICLNRLPGERIKYDKDSHCISAVVNVQGAFAILTTSMYITICPKQNLIRNLDKKYL